jgi:replication factor C small subunit
LISQVDYNSFRDLILEISKQESLEIEDHALDVLYKLTRGSLSKAIDLIQLCSISGRAIDIEMIHDMSQKFEDDLIRSLLLLCLKGEFLKSRELSRTIITKHKYNSHELFALLLRELEKLPLSKYARIQLINLISEADLKALDGNDNDIQISALLSKFCLFSENL